MMERIYNGDGETSKVIEIEGKVYDTESIAISMLVMNLNRFKELTDIPDPLYADFIGSIEGLPNMVKAMKSYDEFKVAMSA